MSKGATTTRIPQLTLAYGNLAFVVIYFKSGTKRGLTMEFVEC